jgi:dephospho-CoA kinase
VVDADAIAREVVEPGTDGLAEVVAVFGREVLLPDGALDRARLGDVVFGDPEARRRLNAIVHPRVGRRMAELDQAAGPDSIVVHDVPLIVENGRSDAYDLVVVVDAPPRTQIERLTRSRDMTREQAEARMAAQASREQRLAIADIVIDNSGSLAELDRQVGDLWAQLRRRAAGPHP